MREDLVEATRRQLGHMRADLDSGGRRVGWKIGFNAPAVQQMLAIEHSLIGHMPTSTLVGADCTHSLAGAQNPLAEPEVAIHVGPDRTIEGLSAAIEVIDMPAIPSAETIADAVERNIFHRAVAIGPAREAEPELTTFTVGDETLTGDAAGVDLEATVELVASILEAAGERLEAGDRIIAGTLTPPQAVAGGDTAALDLGPVGSIDIAFTT